jgi:hypothetical protein
MTIFFLLTRKSPILFESFLFPTNVFFENIYLRYYYRRCGRPCGSIIDLTRLNKTRGKHIQTLYKPNFLNVLHYREKDKK